MLHLSEYSALSRHKRNSFFVLEHKVHFGTSVDLFHGAYYLSAEFSHCISLEQETNGLCMLDKIFDSLVRFLYILIHL